MALNGRIAVLIGLGVVLICYRRSLSFDILKNLQILDLSEHSWTRVTEQAISGWTLVYVLSVLLLLYCCHWIFVMPLNRVRQLDDVGYYAEGKLSRREMANLVRRRRTIGELPPVYPNGWFVALESMVLTKGKSMSIHILGLNLVVFRDDYCQAHIMDAYCPHLGANLGVGGRVFGDCIECPFHGWRFRGTDGQCTHIPTTTKIPDQAKVKAWPTYEVNGFIHIWFHAEGADPCWWPEAVVPISSGQMTYRGRTEHHINSHIEDVPENGADVAHLTQLHGPTVAAGTDIRHTYSSIGQYAKHDWTAQWQAQPAPANHIATVKLTHALSVCGIHIPLADVNVNAKQIGPGIVYLLFNGTLGRFAILQVITPNEPLEQTLIHHIYADWKIPTAFVKLYLTLEAIQVERDIMIWNHKTYLKRPMLVRSDEDSLIGRYRRWYNQFYSTNSPSINFQKDSLEF